MMQGKESHEKSWNLVRPFSDMESHRKYHRLWKVMDNDCKVVEFL